ncbi:MAG TPA: hypothetical protein VFF79_13230 [Conexibacter sp.]|nr:hypothetical protein [Conexibacter sp.]
MAEGLAIESPREHDQRLVGAAEEYRSLRSELIAIERSRLLVLGFSVLALAALGGFGVRTYNDVGDAQTGVAALALFVLLASSLMTSRLSERMQLIRVYLARYVEPALAGAKWEQRQLEREQMPSGRWIPRADEQTVAALLYLGGVAATLVVYFGAPLSRPAYGELAIPLLAAIDVAASLTLIDLRGRNAGQRGWDTFETVALLGATAARPYLQRLIESLRSRDRRLERLRSSIPISATVSFRPASDSLEPDELLRWSGLSQEELAVINTPLAVEGLREVVGVLGGGLGPDGMATWLRAGNPPRLSYLQRGKPGPVIADARRYVDFPRRGTWD